MKAFSLVHEHQLLMGVVKVEVSRIWILQVVTIIATGGCAVLKP